jgi:hypothetical protein
LLWRTRLSKNSFSNQVLFRQNGQPNKIDFQEKYISADFKQQGIMI